MLVKREMIFTVASSEDCRKISRTNLMYWKFGFKVNAVHLRPLLTVLKHYDEQPNLLSFDFGL